MEPFHSRNPVSFSQTSNNDIKGKEHFACTINPVKLEPCFPFGACVFHGSMLDRE